MSSKIAVAITLLCVIMHRHQPCMPLLWVTGSRPHPSSADLWTASRLHQNLQVVYPTECLVAIGCVLRKLVSHSVALPWFDSVGLFLRPFCYKYLADQMFWGTFRLDRDSPWSCLRSVGNFHVICCSPSWETRRALATAQQPKHVRRPGVLTKCEAERPSICGSDWKTIWEATKKRA